MSDRSLALTPDALVMMDTIARSGSFAAAARELGKVPSALTYSVRQLEEALDVLLFDRSSRQARLTAAGEELLQEGRRLLSEIEGVANRVRRVATGWESEMTIAADDVISRRILFELCEAFFSLDPQGRSGAADSGGPGTRLRLRTEVLSGTWEALVSGQADLAIGIELDHEPPPGLAIETLGEMPFIFAVAPHHPLARHEGPVDDVLLVRHRAVAVADSAQRLSPRTLNLLPGQEVLTVNSMADKIEALRRGLGTGFVPLHQVQTLLDRGELVHKETWRGTLNAQLGYAWRCSVDAHGMRRPPSGLALRWWLQQLGSATTRSALIESAP
ncbi:MAG TPA: LysR family transcriptional regulator [Rubrivivax sp.]|nr:LysR family transcriptional regulator [Burkholderiales bacterium]HNU10429.1 LysR family transcriptional regulator [Rubrivivax sp.]